MPSTHHNYIQLYRKLVEEKLLIGEESGKLKQRNFEYIAEKIEQRSRVRLSVSTLKRIWKDNGVQEQQPATLDALVSILDYDDWQAFRAANPITIQTISEPAVRKKRIPVPMVIGGIVVLSLAAFFLLQGFRKTAGQGVSISGDVTFSANKTVTSGVPNSVIFQYDLSNVTADSFFIQQSWNPRDKEAIDHDKQYFTSIYYVPGFHWARLIANDSILSFASIHIKTDGWMPIVKYDIRDNQPFYVDAKKMKHDGMISDDVELLKAVNLDLSKPFKTRFYNIRDFDGVDGDHFDIETRFRCELLPGQSTNTGNEPCPEMQIMLVVEGDIFYVPLMSKGCASKMYLKVGEVYRSGKDNDLSAMTGDPYVWQTLRVKNSGKQVEIFLNDRSVQTFNYKNDFGKIKGIIYTFSGSGSVDFVRIADSNGKMVYADEFEN